MPPSGGSPLPPEVKGLNSSLREEFREGPKAPKFKTFLPKETMTSVPSTEVTTTYSRLGNDLFVTWWHPGTRQRLTMTVRDHSSPFVTRVDGRLEAYRVLYPGQLSHQGMILRGCAIEASRTPSAFLYFAFPDQSTFPLGDTAILEGWLQEMSHIINVDYFAKGNF